MTSRPDPAVLAALLGGAADAATVAYLRPRLAEAGVPDPERYRLTVVVDLQPVPVRLPQPLHDTAADQPARAP